MSITPNELNCKMARNSSLPPRTCRRKRPYSELLSSPPRTACRPAPVKRKPDNFAVSDLTYILSSLCKNSASACFKDPPDPNLYPDYAACVPFHMDLTMVQSALESGLYKRNLAKFKEDVELIWKNAVQYYSPSSAIYALAMACSKDFRRLWHQMETGSITRMSMEARVNDLEAQLKDVNKRLARLSQPPTHCLTSKQVQFLQTTLEALSPTNRLGLVTVVPQHVTVLGAEAQIHIDQITKEEFSVVKRYVESCREVAPQRKERSDFEKQVRRGEAQIMQARAGTDSSDSSEESEAGEDNGHA